MWTQKDAYDMIPFIWSYKTGNTKLCCSEMHYLVGKNIFKRKGNHHHKCQDGGYFGGGGRERFMIGGTQGGFWHPGNVLFLHLDEFALLLLVKLYTYICFMYFSVYFRIKQKGGRGQLYQRLLIGQVTWGLRLDHWVKQSGDSWCT